MLIEFKHVQSSWAQRLVLEWKESWQEEVANAMTHGIALLLSLFGLAALLGACWNNTPHLLAIAVFGATTALMFSASTLYHACSGPIWKARLQILDHVAIYLLIAGTYTPYAVLTLPPGQCKVVLCLVWTLALVGSLCKLKGADRYPTISALSYLI